MCLKALQTDIELAKYIPAKQWDMKMCAYAIENDINLGQLPSRIMDKELWAKAIDAGYKIYELPEKLLLQTYRYEMPYHLDRVP